jgi:hypothetical protein
MVQRRVAHTAKAIRATRSTQTAATAVLNPCSELILDLYGPDAGAHARSAIGVTVLPLDLPVVVSAEVEIAPR